jgi:hypothetical protein
MKFLINWYHNKHLCLDYPIKITGGLIQKITGIPHGGTLVPKILNSNDWIQTLKGGTLTKNAKWLLINTLTNLCAKWTYIIIYLCFTTVVRASDVKLTMMEPIRKIMELGAQFDWVEHLAALIKGICKDYQDNGCAIKFLSLLMSIVTSQIN